MKTKLKLFVAGAVAAGALAALPAGASAAHCVSPAGTSPGFSYFGTAHVQGTSHASEGQGQTAHAPGASACRADTGSPSERAPGRAG